MVCLKLVDWVMSCRRNLVQRSRGAACGDELFFMTEPGCRWPWKKGGGGSRETAATCGSFGLDDDDTAQTGVR